MACGQARFDEYNEHINHSKFPFTQDVIETVEKTNTTNGFHQV